MSAGTSRRGRIRPALFAFLLASTAAGCGAASSYAPPTAVPYMVRAEYDEGYDAGRVRATLGVDEDRALQGLAGGLYTAAGAVRLSLGDVPVLSGAALAAGLTVVGRAIRPGGATEDPPPPPTGSSPAYNAGFEAGYRDGRRALRTGSGIQGAAVGGAIGVLVYWYFRGYPRLKGYVQ